MRAFLIGPRAPQLEREEQDKYDAEVAKLEGRHEDPPEPRPPAAAAAPANKDAEPRQKKRPAPAPAAPPPDAKAGRAKPSARGKGGPLKRRG